MAQTGEVSVPRSVPSQRISAEDSERLKQAFAEDGYFVVKNVVSTEKLAQLRSRIVDEFDRLNRSGALISGGGLISGHLNCFPGEESRFVYEALQERGIVDLIKAIFPRPLGVPNVGCNLNLPNSAVQHYHMDGAFKADFIIANVAVVDTDLTNGAIELIPGTHKTFYKFWRFAVEKPYRFSKRVSMNKGDVLVRASTVWHRGMPNRSVLPRPMVALTFVERRPGEPQADPFLLNEGRIMFYENWYRPTRIGRLRERTVVAVPFTYSAYRFVRSLVGNKGYDTA